MGRPRTFEPQEALNEAMRLFWLKGYEATSMADLMEAMDLHKGSIYKEFGDKKQLFHRALRSYLDQGAVGMRAAMEQAASPREAVESFFKMSLRQCTTGEVVKGCFMMNTVVELGPHDEDIRQMIATFMSGMRSTLIGLIRKGQEMGQFRDDRTPEQLAEFLIFMKAGILTGSKVRFIDHGPSEVVEYALSTIEKSA